MRNSAWIRCVRCLVLFYCSTWGAVLLFLVQSILDRSCLQFTQYEIKPEIGDEFETKVPFEVKFFHKNGNNVHFAHLDNNCSVHSLEPIGYFCSCGLTPAQVSTDLITFHCNNSASETWDHHGNVLHFFIAFACMLCVYVAGFWRSARLTITVIDLYMLHRLYRSAR